MVQSVSNVINRTRFRTLLTAALARRTILSRCTWLVAVTLLLVCTAGADAHAQTADDLMERFLNAWNEPNHEAVETMFAEDIIVFNAGQSVAEGREEVAAAIGSDMDNTEEDGIEMVLEMLRSDTDGNLAFHAGQWKHLDANGEVVANGAYTFAFQHMEGDQWQIISAQIDADEVNDE